MRRPLRHGPKGKTGVGCGFLSVHDLLFTRIMLKHPAIAVPVTALSLAVSAWMTAEPPEPALAAPRSAPLPPTQSTIDPWSELLITHVEVVDDYRAEEAGGPWHFGTLMERMSGSQTGGRLIDGWLHTWTAEPVINGEKVQDPLKTAAIEQFRADWYSLDSNGPNVSPAEAPFRLLAIVNRPDLVRIEGGVVKSAGEARFVYAAFQPGMPTNKESFHVIFEFEVPASTCEEVQAWHTRWHALSQLDPTGEPYRRALQLITDDITQPQGVSSLVHPDGYPPNGSFLGQLRSNEFELNQSLDWDLREWNLVDQPGVLNNASITQVTTKSTPHYKYLRRPATDTLAKSQYGLRDFFDQNQAAILAGTLVFPETFDRDGSGTDWPERGFQTGHAINDGIHPGGTGIATGTLWQAVDYDGWPAGQPLTPNERLRAEVRHLFALNTCSGCHFHETSTDDINLNDFVHISHRDVGMESQLSSFISGLEGAFPDPLAPSIQRQFFDLGVRIDAFDRILQLDCATNGLSELQAIRDARGARPH